MSFSCGSFFIVKINILINYNAASLFCQEKMKNSASKRASYRSGHSRGLHRIGMPPLSCIQHIFRLIPVFSLNPTARFPISPPLKGIPTPSFLSIGRISALVHSAHGLRKFVFCQCAPHRKSRRQLFSDGIASGNHTVRRHTEIVRV